MKPSRWTPHSPGEVLNLAVSHSHLWVQRRCYADPEVNVGTRGALSPTNASSELRGKSNDDGWQLRERPASPELPFGPCPDFKVSMDHFEPYRSASQWPLHPRPKQEKSKEPLASGGGSRSALRKETGPAGGSPAPTHRSSYSRTNPPPPPSLWILSPGLGGGCRPVGREEQRDPPPHWPGDQQPENSVLGLAPVPPQGWRLGLDVASPRPREPPDPPMCLPGPGGPHVGQVGRGAAPSAPLAGRPRGGAARGRGGLCGAACSATPPPADGCRLQQRRRRRRLGVRRGLGTVPTAPGLAPDARPAPAPAPASEPSPGAAAACACLPARRGPAPASASSLPVSSTTHLPPRPALSLRLPGHLLPVRATRAVPRPLRDCAAGGPLERPGCPHPGPSQPRASLLSPSPLGGSSARKGGGGEKRGMDP
nr:translation initiation factor IF-2-like [Pan troglodytes]